MSPLARNFIDLYPSPNRDGLRNNYVVSPTVKVNTYQGDLRLDDNVTNSDQVFVRGSYIGQTRVIPAPLPGIAGGGDYGTGDTSRTTWGAATNQYAIEMRLRKIDSASDPGPAASRITATRTWCRRRPPR